MRKKIAMILLLTMLFNLCACSNDSSQTPDSTSSNLTTNSTAPSTGDTEKPTDNTEETTQTTATESTTVPTENETVREIILPDSSSKLGKDLDYKSSETACYINVNGISNTPKVENWGDAVVVDGVADYLNDLESLGFMVEIINTVTKEPYSAFYTHETNFKVSNEYISWTMYLFIQDEKYVEYQFNINLVPSVPTETPTTPPVQDPTTESPATEGTSPTQPSNNTTETSFDDLVSRYSGRWYLDGYFDVYIDVYLERDGDHSRNDNLCISSSNFAMPDFETDDGLIYPDLQNLDGYCSGFGIIRNDYDSSKMSNYTPYHKIYFQENYIRIGSYKFVTTQGSIARAAGITLNKTSLELYVGESETLIATVFPEGAINKNVTWYFTNADCVTVSSNGIVADIVASAPGCVIITAITEDGHHMATCEVTVKERIEPPESIPSATEPSVTEPPTTEPPATEPPVTEPPVTEPPVTEPITGVLIISDAQTISDQTINTDVYITSTGVATFNNVTVNGNVYCYGKLTVIGSSANNLYAYHWDLGGITASCTAWDGTHGIVKGAFRPCGEVVIQDYALDYAFNKWGKQ